MMAFRKSLCVSVKCGGKILREEGEFVTIPFKSEYSILLKNLHSRRALLNIEIDGMSVFSGLIIEPNKSIELERFRDKPNKFKFIEKTQRISDHRGDRIDDGFIRVEFQFEKELPIYKPIIPVWNPIDYWYHPFGGEEIRYRGGWGTTSGPMRGAGDSITTCAFSSGASCSDMKCATAMNNTDVGITTVGSKSNQQIQSAYIGDLEPNKEVIVIRLRGKKNDGYVQAPVTVNTKAQCAVCGKWNKVDKHPYCPGCGTYLR